MTIDIAAFLERRSRERPYAGAQIYLSRHGERILDIAIGESRPGTPMSRESVLYLSCAGKPFLATVVMHLVAGGALGLTDPVHQHLPGFEVGGKGDITVDDVLTHAGGFRFFDGPGPYLASYGDVLARVMTSELEPRWRPGVDQGYHYETAWYTLAAITEEKLGRPYQGAISDLVFGPLGMDSTWATMDATTYEKVRHRLAVPSHIHHGSVRRSTFLTARAACRSGCPSYGYYGRMSELGRFYEGALARLRGTGHFPLSSNAMTVMTTSIRGRAYDRTFRADYEYGRGFFCGLAGAWGHGDRWSPSSFGMSGYVGHTVGAADPETGVVMAASFGALASDGDEITRLTDGLYDIAMAAP